MQLMKASQNENWNKTSDIWNYLVNDIIEKGGNFYTHHLLILVMLPLSLINQVDINYFQIYLFFLVMDLLYNIAPGVLFSS